MKEFDFNDLFILDVANNHQGDLNHGLNIIKELGSVVHDAGVRAAIKFQYRQLDTFIHPDHTEGSDAQHIPRFIDTRLPPEDYVKLIDAVRRQNMITMCTPFDEESISLIQKHGIDVIKVASCSVTDIPLLKEVVMAGKPVIISTGGASLSDIDRVVHLMVDNSVHFALEHCVSIYPTPPDQLQLNQINVLLDRYPDISVGWSTHEDPDDTITVQLAVAKGASLFERHVGLQTGTYSLNKYSSTPQQIKVWLDAHSLSRERCGSVNRGPSPVQEVEALRSLQRGVFAKQIIKKGDVISREDIFFAMPTNAGGMNASEWGERYVADKDYLCNEQLSTLISQVDESTDKMIERVLLQVRGMLHTARIKLADSSKIELSHHYGLSRFREFGAIIIDVINRDYCKKLIILLPRQKHPYHFHKRKEETFQVLYGDLEVEKNGSPCRLQPGDLYLVQPECWHKFSSQNGVIFEEISTTHYDDDSFYEDESISKLPRATRKTVVTNWEL